MLNTDSLKDFCNGLGFQKVGVCPAKPAFGHAYYMQWLARGNAAEMGYLTKHAQMRKAPQTLLPNAKSVIALRLNYNQPISSEPNEPKIARYALGRDYHLVIRAKLKRLQTWLDAQYPDGIHRACVDSAPILEREYAHLAGLGWFGKNTLLIDSREGSYFFIALLLTTLEFEPDQPSEGGCGTCTNCIDQCPTQAIALENGRWRVDSRRCISYWTIEHKGEFPRKIQDGLNGWTFGCDVCQEVCPFNAQRPTQPERAAFTTEPDFVARYNPTLAQLADISEADWDVWSRGRAVRRSGHAGIRRNAKANLKHS